LIKRKRLVSESKRYLLVNEKAQKINMDYEIILQQGVQR